MAKVACLFLLITNICSVIKPCNRDLLTFFNLKGNPVPIETKMLICPGIQENCCSVADEISIYSLWKNFTVPKMDRHIDDILILYKKILHKHKRIVNLDEKKIEIKHTINKIVMYPLELCEQSLGSVVSRSPRELVSEEETHPIMHGHHKAERILSEMGEDFSSYGGMGGGGLDYDSMKMNLQSDYAKNLSQDSSSFKDKYKGKSIEEMQAQLQLMQAGGSGPSMGGMDMSSMMGNSGSDSLDVESDNFNDMKSMMSTVDPSLAKSDFDLSSSTGDQKLDEINHAAKEHLDDFTSAEQDEKLNSSLTPSGSMGSMSMGGMSNFGNMANMGGVGGSSFSRLGSMSMMPGSVNVNSPTLPPRLSALSNTLSNISDTATSKEDLQKKVESALAQLSGMTGINNSLDDSKPQENRKLNMDDAIELDTGKTTETNMISPIQTPAESVPKKKLKMQEEEPKKAVKSVEQIPKHKKHHKKHMISIEEIEKKEELRKKREKRKLMDSMYYRPPNVILHHLPRHIKCSVTKKKIPKSFKVKNKKKREFCEHSLKKLKNYPVQDLYDYLENMKPTMRQMIGMKKTFYCSLCDQPKQFNINTQARTITFSQGFCKTLVTEFQDYIKLHNLIFVKYFDALLQYARCFTTLASESVFPMKSLLKEKMMRIKYINRCFTHSDDPNFMDYCFYLCDQFSYTSLSGFFDGDIQFLKKVNFFLLSFLRKFENDEPLTSPALDEPMDLHSVNFDDPIYMEEQEKENLLLPPEDAGLPEDAPEEEEDLPNPKFQYQNFIDVDMDESEEIYESKKTKMIFDRFLPKFINSHKAINPFIMDSHVNFEVDMKNLISEQCNEDGEEPEEELNRGVLSQYFSINKQDLDEFKNDLFLPFADYTFFEMEKKKKEEEMEELGFVPKPDEKEIRKKELVNYKEIRPHLGTVEGVTINRLHDDEDDSESEEA